LNVGLPTISIAQDLLTHYHWDVFKRDLIFYMRKESTLKAAAIGAYLTLADSALSLMEAMRG
jgi:hypothetical protein